MSKKKKSGNTGKPNPQPSKGRRPDSNSPESGEPTGDASNAAIAPTGKTLPTALTEADNIPVKLMLSRYVSFGLLLAVIALLGILFYEVMAQFLVPLFLAALLVVVFRPFYQWILTKTGGREKVSALLTTASILLAVLVPIGVLLVMAAAEGRQVYSQFNATRIVEGVRQIRTNLNLDMPSQIELRLIENQLLELQQNFAITPAEEDRHQISLYEIEEAAKILANEQGFASPGEAMERDSENAEAEPFVLRSSDWESFNQCLKESRALHDLIPWRSNDDAVEQKERNVALHDYQVKLNETASHFSDFRTSFLGGKTKAWLTEMFNPSDRETEAYATTVVNFLRDRFFKLSGAGIAYVFSLALGMAIMIAGLYFFLIDGPKMIEAFKGLSPIDDDHEQELVAEFGRVSRAVVVATLLSALVQGMLAGIGFYFTGLDSIFLLTVLSAVLAMVPFFGAAAVWVPCCLYLYFFDNSIVSAVGLGIYGVAVISMADNIIKPLILHGQSNLHPLFAFLSVLGGVSALGPIGILIGPMVVAFLQTLLKILQREMSDLEQLAHEN